MKKYAILLALSALPIACGGGSGDAAAVAAGKQLFTDNICVTCHGETGEGDGPASVALEPKPRKYSDATWQDATTDETIKNVIVDGGLAHGLSALMPPNPTLKGRTADLNNIVAYIRSLKK